jgi:nicotinamide-nucleotide amidase
VLCAPTKKGWENIKPKTLLKPEGMATTAPPTIFTEAMLKKIGKSLLASLETVAVAESVTSGLIQYGLASIPDASRFYQGGITAYNVAQKYKHLHVEPIHALATDCVSLQVAEEMSLHVCGMFNSDWGLAVTGYATATPESGNSMFAYYSIAYKNKIKRSGIIKPGKKDAPVIQIFYAAEVLRFLEILLKAATKKKKHK